MTNTAQYTPGTWTRTRDAEGVFTIHACGNNRAVARLASVTTFKDELAEITEAEAEANACLIAAAPDCHKANLAFVAWLDSCEKGWPNEALLYRAASKARAALANAGGVPLPTAPASDTQIVAVSVRGGLINDVEANIPVTVIIEDWDVPDEDTGNKFTRSVYTLAGGLSGAKAEKLRCLIAND